MCMRDYSQRSSRRVFAPMEGNLAEDEAFALNGFTTVRNGIIVSHQVLRGKGLPGLHGVGTKPITASLAPLHMFCNMRTHQSCPAHVYMLLVAYRRVHRPQV